MTHDDPYSLWALRNTRDRRAARTENPRLRPEIEARSWIFIPPALHAAVPLLCETHTAEL